MLKSINTTIDVLERVLSNMFDEEHKKALLTNELQRLYKELKKYKNNTGLSN